MCPKLDHGSSYLWNLARQTYDPHVMSISPENCQLDPEVWSSVPAVPMDMPDMCFHCIAQNIGGDAIMDPRQIIESQVNPPGYLGPNFANSWHSNPPTLTGPPCQAGNFTSQGSESLYNNHICSDVMKPQYPHDVICYPQMEGNLRYHGETGEHGLGWEHLPEMMMECNIQDQETRPNNQQQDDWAQPKCRTPYPLIGLTGYEASYP